MVSATVEKLSPTRVKLFITVTPEELKSSIDHAYEHIAEQVSIPGFRKGKVPPPIIDQRVGRAEVLNHAVSEGLDRFYREAAQEEKLRPLGRPAADVTQWPSAQDFSGDLLVEVEVDVRPEFELPAYEGLKVEVDEIDVTADQVEEELEQLRARFGTLITVDRPAKTGDFLSLDLVATIDGREVDTASGISYELGSGELIEGIDDAVETLTAGESTTFSSTLLGGDNEGDTAEIAVTVLSVKEREIPEADDDFAQIASQFDTIGELRADLREQLGKQGVVGQSLAARDKVVGLLLEKVDIPVPAQLVEDEVHRHLEAENRLDDDAHRAEVTESSETTFRTQILLDAIVEKEEITVGQDELTRFLIQESQRYGMEPTEFIRTLDQGGQIPAMVAEVGRSKAVATVISKAKVVDTKGKAVDVSEYTKAVLGDPDGLDVSGAADLLAAVNADHDDHDHDHEGHAH